MPCSASLSGVSWMNSPMACFSITPVSVMSWPYLRPTVIAGLEQIAQMLMIPCGSRIEAADSSAEFIRGPQIARASSCSTRRMTASIDFLSSETSS